MRGSGLLGIIAGVVLTAGSLSPSATVVAVDEGLVVQDIENGATVVALARSLVGGGLWRLQGLAHTGSQVAAGAFTGGADIIGFESGIVLGTGRVQTAPLGGACFDKGVEGPNECDTNGTANMVDGNADLDAFGFNWDAAVLEFDFFPVSSTLKLDYVFASDEYNELANELTPDAFAIFVNGTNCATVPGEGWPVSIDTINGGNPYGEDSRNVDLYRNNDIHDGLGATIDTEMDGLTTVLTCTAAVNAGLKNHIKIAIADSGDSVTEVDSNVFIRAGSLHSPCAASPFSDVPVSHPFCGEIEWMKNNNISTGFPDGSYGPNLPVTRQAMSAFLRRLHSLTPLPDCTSAPFSDVPVDHPFCPQIKWMKDFGISTGFSDGTFRPALTVTRQSMSAFLSRFAGALHSPCTSAPFSDVPVDHPFCAEIKWMATFEVSTGFSDGTFRPGVDVTRQGMSAFMFRERMVLTHTSQE